MRTKYWKNLLGIWIKAHTRHQNHPEWFAFVYTACSKLSLDLNLSNKVYRQILRKEDVLCICFRWWLTRKTGARRESVRAWLGIVEQSTL